MGFVGEGGVFGIMDEGLEWIDVDEDNSEVDDDPEEDDDREESPEVKDSSELDDALRPLCEKYVGFAKDSNGEDDRDAGGRRIESIGTTERSERGEVSSIK